MPDAVDPVQEDRDREGQDREDRVQGDPDHEIVAIMKKDAVTVKIHGVTPNTISRRVIDWNTAEAVNGKVERYVNILREHIVVKICNFQSGKLSPKIHKFQGNLNEKCGLRIHSAIYQISAILSILSMVLVSMVSEL